MDILIIVFIIFIIAIGFNNGMIKNICKIINLSSASILSSLIITNLSIQFPILNKTQDVVFLSIFLLIFMALLFLVGFIIEFIVEQVETVEIDKYLEIVMNIVAGAVKGLVLVAFYWYNLLKKSNYRRIFRILAENQLFENIQMTCMHHTFIVQFCFEFYLPIIGPFLHYISIICSIPPSFRIVGFEYNFAPSIVDEHLKIKRVKTGGEYWLKSLVKFITIRSK